MEQPELTQPAEPESDLQRLIDAAFAYKAIVSQLDLVLSAENHDLDEEVMEVVGLLPPGTYLRHEMCDQLNSIITAHGWGMTVGTVA